MVSWVLKLPLWLNSGWKLMPVCGHVHIKHVWRALECFSSRSGLFKQVWHHADSTWVSPNKSTVMPKVQGSFWKRTKVLWSVKVIYTASTNQLQETSQRWKVWMLKFMFEKLTKTADCTLPPVIHAFFTWHERLIQYISDKPVQIFPTCITSVARNGLQLI